MSGALVRVYVPLTSSTLAAAVAAGRVEASADAPLRAHALTAALRRAWPEAEDDEEWEYAALMAAGAASLEQRGDGDRPRRYVLALDVPAVVLTELDDHLDPTLVEVAGDVPEKRWSSVHADVADLDDARIAAVLADEEPAGDDGWDGELAWYALQEVGALLA